MHGESGIKIPHFHNFDTEWSDWSASRSIRFTWKRTLLYRRTRSLYEQRSRFEHVDKEKTTCHYLGSNSGSSVRIRSLTELSWLCERITRARTASFQPLFIIIMNEGCKEAVVVYSRYHPLTETVVHGTLRYMESNVSTSLRSTWEIFWILLFCVPRCSENRPRNENGGRKRRYWTICRPAR